MFHPMTFPAGKNKKDSGTFMFSLHIEGTGDLGIFFFFKFLLRCGLLMIKSKNLECENSLNFCFTVRTCACVTKPQSKLEAALLLGDPWDTVVGSRKVMNFPPSSLVNGDCGYRGLEEGRNLKRSTGRGLGRFVSWCSFCPAFYLSSC